MPSTFATLSTAVGICLAGPANASMQADDRAAGAATLVESGYAPVNGLNMYYEIHGSGPPLVLLHGTLSAIGTSFGDLIPFLAATRRVVAIEQQAHGRTADVDRPLSYKQMADDTNALLRYLGIERADILGYSMGGIIAMQMALDRCASSCSPRRYRAPTASIPGDSQRSRI